MLLESEYKVKQKVPLPLKNCSDPGGVKMIREAIEMHCQAPAVNGDNGYELPVNHWDILSRAFHQAKSRDKTSNPITWLRFRDGIESLPFT